MIFTSRWLPLLKPAVHFLSLPCQQLWMTPQAAFCSVPAGKGAELKTYISVYRWCSPVCCFKNVEFPMSLSYVPEGINIEIQGLVGQKSARNAFEVDLWDVVETCGNHEEMWKYTLLETWHEQAVNPGSQLLGSAWWLDWSPCWKYVMHTYYNWLVVWNFFFHILGILPTD